MMIYRQNIILTILVLWVSLGAFADTRMYHCELGLQAGCGYYAGDATPHIFNNPRETYGGHFRYKFDKRWALQVKGLQHTITGHLIDDNGQRMDGMWVNHMINLDVMAEFNFFRFGGREYDQRVKPITPYIFLGVGMSLYDLHFQTVGAYLPVGLGLKWKFADRWGLNLAWQHNIYFADNLESTPNLSNTYSLNGWNIMNNDITSQLTLGIVFEFAKEKKVCRFCDDN